MSSPGLSMPASDNFRSPLTINASFLTINASFSSFKVLTHQLQLRSLSKHRIKYSQNFVQDQPFPHGRDRRCYVSVAIAYSAERGCAGDAAKKKDGHKQGISKTHPHTVGRYIGTYYLRGFIPSFFILRYKVVLWMPSSLAAAVLLPSCWSRAAWMICISSSS